MEELNAILEKLAEPKCYSIKEVSKMMKMSLATTREMFNRKDFPSIDFGKEKKVEREALIEYFKVPRRR